MRKIKNLPATIFALFAVLFLPGCKPNQPTYTKEKTVESIISLCQREYKIEPKVWLSGDTIWIYISLPGLFKKDLQLDKDASKKINDVIFSASRVVLSMKPRPLFMSIVASDTEEYGLDYTMTIWIMDIVKAQFQVISRDDFFQRIVNKLTESSEAYFDTEGKHIQKNEIKMGDFLAAQVGQRISFKFLRDPKFKDYFDVEDIEAKYEDETFRIKTDIKPSKKIPPAPIDVSKEIIKIVAYVIRIYDFKKFLLVDVKNNTNGEKFLLSRAALLEYR